MAQSPDVASAVLCCCVIFERQDGPGAMISIAIGIAVGESRKDLSQVVGADRLGAQRTRRLPAGRPAIHQDKSHGMPPNVICLTDVDDRKQKFIAGLLVSRSHNPGPTNCRPTQIGNHLHSLSLLEAIDEFP